MSDPQQTPEERGSDCSLEVRAAIEKTLNEYRPRLKQRYSIDDDYVNQAYAVALLMLAVEEYEAMHPVRLEPAKRLQLFHHVRYLIVGAIAESAQ